MSKNLQKITPLLVVPRIEPCLPLWEKLGFGATVTVPHGDRAGFVLLASGDREVMLQSRASLRGDAARVAASAKEGLLYCDVASLDAARKAVRAVKGCEVLIDERETPYGARELWMVDPAGRVMGFAEHA